MVSFLKLIFGILLNPVVLLGLGISWYFIFHYGLENCRQLLSLPYIYGILWAICLVYALAFKRVFVPNSNTVDWWGTFKSSFAHLVVLLVTIAVACCIYFVTQDDWSTKLDRYARNQKAQDTLPINQ